MLISYNDSAHTEIYTLSLHDALPISGFLGIRFGEWRGRFVRVASETNLTFVDLPKSKTKKISVRRRVDSKTSAVISKEFERSEEHTSELQSRRDLVCRLLLEKKNIGD